MKIRNCILVVLFAFCISVVNLTAQASTGGNDSTGLFPYWTYDPYSDYRVQDLKQYFDGWYTAEWRIVTFEEVKNLSQTLQVIANNFNRFEVEKKAVAICARTELYTLGETDYNKQQFAVIIITGFLKDDVISKKQTEHVSANPAGFNVSNNQ